MSLVNLDEPSVRWVYRDGSVVSCTEKVKVLEENLEELRQSIQDAFEDALLMGVSERQFRLVLAALSAGLVNPYHFEEEDKFQDGKDQS